MHWAEAKKWHDGWFSEVAIAARLATRGKAMVPYLRARVIVDYQVVRLMDVDNLHGSAKPLLDALKDAHGGAGVIVDDSPEHIELVVRQCKVGKINEQGVLLTIEKI